MPQDLLDALGAERGDASARPRDDAATRCGRCRRAPIPSCRSSRTFTLPGARTFALTGSASVNPDAADAAIDAALGDRAGGHRRRERVARRAACSATRRARPTAIPRPRGTRRSSASAASGCSSTSPQPITFSTHEPAGRRRRPALGARPRSSSQVDGAGARARRCPPIADEPPRTRRATVPLHFPAMTGTPDPGHDHRRARRSSRRASRPATRSPRRSAIAELGIPGLRVGAAHRRAARRVPLRSADDRRPAGAGARDRRRERGRADSTGSRSTPCDPRDPRARADDHARARRARDPHVGGRAHRRAARSARARVGRGRRRRSRSRDGRVTGLGDAPPRRADGHGRAQRRDADARARDAAPTRRSGSCSASRRATGWTATIVDGGRARPVAARRRLRQRLARATRRSASFDVVLEWTPQRQVWAAIWISLLAALAVPRDRRAGRCVRRRRGRRDRCRSRRRRRVRSSGRSRRAASRRAVAARRAIVVPVLAGLVGRVDRRAVGRRARARARRRDPVATAAARGARARPAGAARARDACYIVYLQHHFRFPPVFEWPTLFPLARPSPGSRWCSSASTWSWSGCSAASPEPARPSDR